MTDETTTEEEEPTNWDRLSKLIDERLAAFHTTKEKEATKETPPKETDAGKPDRKSAWFGLK
jgi:hypothetical protein